MKLLHVYLRGQLHAVMTCRLLNRRDFAWDRDLTPIPNLSANAATVPGPAVYETARSNLGL